jgi:hypothetical protein
MASNGNIVKYKVLLLFLDTQLSYFKFLHSRSFTKFKFQIREIEMYIQT